MNHVLSFGETILAMFLLGILVLAWGVYREAIKISELLKRDDG